MKYDIIFFVLVLIFFKIILKNNNININIKETIYRINFIIIFFSSFSNLNFLNTKFLFNFL